MGPFGGSGAGRVDCDSSPDGSEVTTASEGNGGNGREAARGAAEVGQWPMTGWTTSSAEKGGRTGLGEGERDDGADMAGRIGMDRLGLRDWRGLVLR